MKKKKIIWAAVGLVFACILIAAGFSIYMMGQPLYRVGMVREGKNLSSPLAPADMAGDPQFWQVEEGIRLFHFQQGDGRSVLMIHGGPGLPTRTPWTGLEPLQATYQFLYYDQRGCGDSSRPFNRFESKNTYQNMTDLEKILGLGAQIADIERIRLGLGEQKLILIGHSWGGFLASLYAAEFPEHVEALVLVSPAAALVKPDPEGDLFQSVRARLPEEGRPGFDDFMKTYMDFNSLFAKSETELVEMNERFGKYYQQVAYTPAIEHAPTGGWMVWAMYLSMGRRHDYRPSLQGVTVPVLVLHGADDLQSEAVSREYADLFPNAQFVVIEEAGHFAFHEQPDAFASSLANFLSGLGE